MKCQSASPTASAASSAAIQSRRRGGIIGASRFAFHNPNPASSNSTIETQMGQEDMKEE